MRIKERCSCGAEVEVEAASSLAENHIAGWRANHNHIVRSPNYPYVTWGQGGAVGGYSPITYTTNAGTVSTHTCDEGDDGKCETCGRDMDGYE